MRGDHARHSNNGGKEQVQYNDGKRDLECPCLWQPEEKIVALEAKLDSTVKNLNKKVATEWGKNKEAANRKAGTYKGKSKKKDRKLGEHPKTWAAPKPGDKKEGKYKDQHMWYWCGKDAQHLLHHQNY